MIRIIKKKSSGILLHVSSLPGSYGIGDLGSAVHFIDFLKASGQSYWQILPLGPTSPVFGNSPYMSFSSFAGNPLLISPELLVRDGFLDAGDLGVPDFSEYFVEYERVILWKQTLVDQAWHHFQSIPLSASFSEFCAAHSWLDDYALFMALKHQFNQSPWYEWPKELRERHGSSLHVAAGELTESVDYYRFEQHLFFRQWQRLRDYAHQQGIRIIGDLPFYVGPDSVDVWANQSIFELDRKTRLPTRIAGVPPDYFSETGQRWGNPLYRWNTRKADVKRELYDWWAGRLSALLSLVDIIRIDHFRGFESYWSIPAQDATAENGIWKKGPGLSFFKSMGKRLGSLPIIAEDLGIITPAVEKLRDKLGYPGMKILMFAFDGHGDNPYLPFNFPENCVVYTGTHDNDTAVGWFLDPDVPIESKLQLKMCANRKDDMTSPVHQDFIYLAVSSTALLCILPLQDVLGFGNDCRMNTPATTRGNWQWRCASRFLNDEVAGRLHEQTRCFGRLPIQELSA